MLQCRGGWEPTSRCPPSWRCAWVQQCILGQHQEGPLEDRGYINFRVRYEGGCAEVLTPIKGATDGSDDDLDSKERSKTEEYCAILFVDSMNTNDMDSWQVD